MKTIFVVILMLLWFLFCLPLVAVSAGAGEPTFIDDKMCRYEKQPNGEYSPVCSAAWIDAGEPGEVLKWKWSVPEAKIAETNLVPIRSMQFELAKPDEYATLSWEGGIFKFSGDPDKSAVVFLDWVQQYYDDRAKMYCPQNSEIKALLERLWYTVWAAKIVCRANYKETSDVECRDLYKQHQAIEDMIGRLK